ncbi:MAG: hypothetical protein ACHQU1_03195 [Gemmatimonadales bacterium]
MNHMQRGMLIVPVAAVVIGCGRVREMVTDMVHVQRCATERSGTKSINMNLGTGKRFTLGLVDSPLDTLPAEARAAGARRVALCVRENYHRYADLNEVAISFTHKTTVGPANVSTTTSPLVFAMRDLGTATPATDSSAGQTKAPN